MKEEHSEDESLLYQGNFKYIYVPCELSQPSSERLAPKAGGLEKDALRLLAEEHFDPSSNGLKGSSVEIVSLLLPAQDYNYVGVSMYCDAIGKNKQLPINQRASSIANLCNHQEAIHGDVFFGKYHDDESKPWVRLDFSMDDMNSDAEWCKIAQVKNQGAQRKAYSTSSVLQNMMNNKNGNGPAIITPDNLTTAPTHVQHYDNGEDSKTENEALKWTQTADEIEMKIKLPGVFKSSDFNIQIKSKKLIILLKSGKSIPLTTEFTNNEKITQIFQSTGGELFQKIDPDSSSWQLSKSKNGNETVLEITLAKTSAARWLELLA